MNLICTENTFCFSLKPKMLSIANWTKWYFAIWCKWHIVFKFTYSPSVEFGWHYSD